jgi:hypothetical protein
LNFGHLVIFKNCIFWVAIKGILFYNGFDFLNMNTELALTIPEHSPGLRAAARSENDMTERERLRHCQQDD